MDETDSKTRNGQDKAQLERLITNLVTKDEVPQAEEIAAGAFDSEQINPVYLAAFELIKGNLSNPQIAKHFSRADSPEKLKYLFGLDFVYSLFDKEKHKEVLDNISLKLSQGQDVEEIAKYAAMELGNKISKKERKSIMKKFYQKIDDLTSDFEKIKDEEVKRRIKEKMPTIDDVFAHNKDKKERSRLEEKAKEEMPSELSGYVLKEFYKDVKKIGKKIGKGTAVVGTYALGIPALGLIGMLPQRYSSKIIDKLIDKKMLDSEDDKEAAFFFSAVMEVAGTIGVWTYLGVKKDPNYFLGYLSLLPLTFYLYLRSDTNDKYENKFSGSILTTAPFYCVGYPLYFVGTGLAWLGKGLFYSLPKSVYKSAKGYKENLKKRAYNEYLKNQEKNGKPNAS